MKSDEQERARRGEPTADAQRPAVGPPRARRAALTCVLLASAVVATLLVLGGAHRRRPTASVPARRTVSAKRTRGRPASAARPAVGEGRAIDRVLTYTSYVRLAGRRHRDVALTFDDGPSRYTPQILRVLKRLHAPATFFVIGREARAHPQLLAGEVRAGCEVGDHTETHPFLAALSPDAQAAQITQAAAAIHHAAAPWPRLLRPPYGSFDRQTLSLLASRRMLMVLWSADTKDYARPGVRRIIYTAVSGAQPGAIILMHDGGGDRSQTVAALSRIITRLRERGFRLLTVSQLVADDPPPRQPPPHPLSGIG